MYVCVFPTPPLSVSVCVLIYAFVSLYAHVRTVYHNIVFSWVSDYLCPWSWMSTAVWGNVFSLWYPDPLSICLPVCGDDRETSYYEIIPNGLSRKAL